MKTNLKTTTLWLAIALLAPTMNAQKCFDMTQLGQDVISCFDEDIVMAQPAPDLNLYAWYISNTTPDHPRQHVKTDSREYDALVTDLKVLPPNGQPTIMLSAQEYAAGQYAQGAGIIFQHVVTADAPIILFNFAGIMEKTPHLSCPQILNFDDYIQPSIDFYMTIGEKGHEQTLKETPIHFTPNNSRTWTPVIDSRGYAAVWRDWTTMAFDLTKYIGEQVNIVATVRDCAFEDYLLDLTTGALDFIPCRARHTARLYCNVDCASDKPVVNQDCEAGSTTIRMPEGFYSYKWYYSSEPDNILGTTPEITIPTHHRSDTMCCAVAHYVIPDTAIVKKFFLDNCGNYEVCADAQTLSFSLNNLQANIDHCDIAFSQEALAQGFQNATDIAVAADKTVTINMPVANATHYVRPNVYSADVTAYLADGSTITSTKNFSVLYPSFVLGQDWNDVLYVKNQNYNGGYGISSVIWYKNGDKLAGSGEHGAFLYNKTKFEEGDYYWAELTRTDDGKAIRTCSCQPSKQKYADNIQFDIQVTSNAPGRITITSEQESGEYTLYTIYGQSLLSGHFGPQYNASELEITTTSVAGTYIMNCRGENGTNKSIKIIIE